MVTIASDIQRYSISNKGVGESFTLKELYNNICKKLLVWCNNKKQ